MWLRTSDSYFSDGLLAHTPAQFEASGNIIHCKDLAVTSFFLTNRGLHLNLRLKTWEKSKLCLAVLDCRRYKGIDKYLGIYLERQSESSDVFKRVWGNEMGDIDDADVPNLKHETVFVKQERAITTLSDYSYYRVVAKDLEMDGTITQRSPPLEESLIKSLIPIASTVGNMSVDVFRLHDKHGNGFFLLVKTWREVLAPLEYRSCLSANIIELIDKYNSLEPLWFDLNNKPMLLEEVWPSEKPDRFRWQHPRRKYWINVDIRRQFSGNKRWKSITLSREHAPTPLPI